MNWNTLEDAAWFCLTVLTLLGGTILILAKLIILAMIGAPGMQGAS